MLRTTLTALASLSCALLLAHAAPAQTDAATPAGMRQLASRHLLLITDLPPSAAVDALPELFDQAFAQWCAYFALDPVEHQTWRAQAHLMRSRERFRAAGLLPADLPNFATGYARGAQFWLDEQAGDYYRLHLLLHEGTHALMHTLLGGIGAPWYAEGTAELLATHRLDDGKLTLNVFPRSREAVPKWGRIEIVQTAFAARQALSLPKLLAIDQRGHENNDAYGWCWAAAAFLDGHPRYRDRFRALARGAAKPDFAALVSDAFAADWAQLNEDWQLFVANVDYGYDFARMEVDRRAGAPLQGQPARVTVTADRGWQSSGIRLEAGQTYRLRAKGRYQLGAGPRPWPCEPGGVTIRYYHGQPLGILLGAVRDDARQPEDSSGLVRPQVIGLETTLAPRQSGTLYFRINDAPADLANNRGELSVEVVPK